MIPGSFPVLFAPSSGGHVIEGSGLFNGTNSRLSRTALAGDSRQKFTIEWLGKISDPAGGTNHNDFYTHQNPDTNHDLCFNMRSNQLRVMMDGTNTANIITTPIFRDPSGFYHFIIAVDTTQGTAANRVKFYVNGVQITTFGTANYPSQNYNSGYGTTDQEGWGYSTSQLSYVAGNVARVSTVDNQQLDPTSYGELTNDGFWQINDISELTFGTSGLLIEGGADMAAGYDSSLVATADRPTATVSASASQFTGATSSVNFSGR